MKTSRDYGSIVEALRSVLLSIEDAVVEEREAVEEEQAQTATTGARSPSGAVDEHHPPPEFLIRASRDSWSRSARRKRRRDENGPYWEPSSRDGDDMKTVSDFFHSAVLVGVVRLAGQVERQVRAQRDSKEHRLVLEFQWVYGWDRSVFESFVSHVRRRVLGEGTKATITI
jgi:hypothetical protein